MNYNLLIYYIFIKENAQLDKIFKNIYKEEIYEETSKLQVFCTHLCYIILEIFGHLRAFLRRYGFEKRKGAVDNNSSVSLHILEC